MKRLFVDTGAWYALTDKRDPDHRNAVQFLRKNTYPLVTTNFVFDETITLLRMRIGWEAAAEFGRKLKSSRLVTIIAVNGEDENRAWDIFLKFRDKDFSYTDCTSFAVMQRLKLETAFTFDGHFEMMKFAAAP
jgi:hypothetical protein